MFTVALKFETRKPLDEKKPKQIKCLTSGNWGSEKGLSLTVCFTLLPFLMIEHQSNNGLKINTMYIKELAPNQRNGPAEQFKILSWVAISISLTSC